MILADTSVVIDFLCTADPKLQRIVATEPAAVCGITRAEVLVGARDPAHRTRLISGLAVFAQLAIPETLWDTVGEHGATLRRDGVTVPFADIVIATVALHHDVELWTRDLQFTLVQRLIPALRLFQEPP
jgi:predicted nucleic acid-binding protein